MSDRKQIAFNDSLQDQFMKTEGKNATDKMMNLLAVDNKRQSEIRDVDKKVDYIISNIEDIKKMLEGIVR